VIKEGFKLIDSMHTSDTEEIAAKSKAKTDLLEAYAPFKVAQRYLALMFASTFLFSFFMVLGMTLFADADLEAVRAVISEFWLAQIMTIIITFYFGSGFVEGTLKARNSK